MPRHLAGILLLEHSTRSLLCLPYRNSVFRLVGWSISRYGKAASAASAGDCLAFAQVRSCSLRYSLSRLLIRAGSDKSDTRQAGWLTRELHQLGSSV